MDGDARPQRRGWTVGGRGAPDLDPTAPTISAARRATLQRVGRGDQAALAALYDDLAPAVWQVVSLTSADPGRCASAVRRTFVDLWRLAPDAQATAGLSVEAWVLATAHRLARGEGRDPTAEGPRDLGARASRQADQSGDRQVTNVSMHVFGGPAVRPPTEGRQP